MENMEHDHLTEIDISIDGEVRRQFSEAGKWAKFISIVIFIACGLSLLFGVIGGAALLSVFKGLGARNGFLGNFGGAGLIFVIVVVVAVIALLYYFLFDFSRKIKTALLTENIADLNAGLKSLKIFFIVTSLFGIISLLNSIINIFF